MDDRDLAARPAPDLADDGVPATEEVRDEVLHTGDPGVGDVPAPDRPWGAEEWGTTELEQRAGEPLDRRLARDTPDGDRHTEAGWRLSEPDADGDLDDGFVGTIDTEADLVGELDLSHGDMLSPEEAAITVREHAPGGTYDDSPGYLDEE